MSSIRELGQATSSIHHPQVVSSLLLPRQSIQSDSNNIALSPPEESLLKGDLQTKVDTTTQHPFLDPDQVEGHQETISKVRLEREQCLSRMKEEEQCLKALDEEIFCLEVILNDVEPPAHLNITNIFDDVHSLESVDEKGSGSPGGKTLVEGGPATPARAATSNSPTTPRRLLDLKYEKSDDIPMTDLILETNPQEKDLSSTAPQKRKRFSRPCGAKKARFNNFTYNDLSTNPDDLLVPSTQVQKAWSERVDHALNNPPHPDNDNAPSRTSRPISWPRNRLFRRSAGVSVKTLTEAFEKMGLRRDQH
ncbi:MAG: hypothetical protein Q9202_007057 [Teloschistes flavicans]